MIVRHGDLGPWNTVWRDEHFVGVIDWDFARPGERIEDLAQLLRCCVPLRFDEACRATGIEPAQRLVRLAACCARAGVDEGAMIDAVLALQDREREEILELGAAGLEPWRTFLARGDAEDIATEQAWLRHF